MSWIIRAERLRGRDYSWKTGKCRPIPGPGPRTPLHISLSGGETARLLFCRILLQKPNVLVLDFKGSDEEFAEELAATQRASAP